MDCKTIVNSIGIILTIIGIYVVYINSPINFDTIDGGDFTTDGNENKIKTSSKNSWLRRGVHIIIIGSVIQLISNFIPPKEV